MKGTPTRRRAAALTQQRNRGEQLRTWLQDKATAAAKRRAERAQAKAEAAETAGQPPAEVVYLHEHNDELTHRVRRAWAKRTGRRMPSGTNRPYLTPVSELRPGKGASRRLRKELLP